MPWVRVLLALKVVHNLLISNGPDQVVNEEHSLDPEKEANPTEGIRLREEEAILRRAAEDLARRRAQTREAPEANMVPTGSDDSFQLVANSLESAPPDVRNGTTRTLFKLNPSRATSFFNSALRESSPERRREIGAALAGSGLATDAVNAITSRSAEQSYRAFALLCLLAKAGVIKPLVGVIEEHPRIDLRVAVIKLLELSGETDIVPVFRNLTTSNALPDEVRSAIVQAICRIDSSG